MSVTSGFFNSIEGDRKYTAEQMAAIFDGIIQEGVYHSIGNKFAVTVSDGENFVIAVDSGRAWLNNTWILNDAKALYTLDLPELLLSRIDAIVLKADRSSEVRQGTIEIIKGSPSSTPQKPTWTDTAEVKRMAIAYVTLGPNVQSISQSNIEYVVGLDSTPYVTSVLEKISVEELFTQWKAQWDEWSTEERTEFSEWMDQEKVDFVAWFEGLQVILDDDVATALSNRLLVLEHDCIVGGEDPENPDVDIEFESADTELQPTTTESVELLDSTDIWTVRLHKISQMFKNIRYLLKMMGSTDISSIGNGTVTGALSSLTKKKFIETNGSTFELTTTYTVVPCTSVAANPDEEYFGTGSNGIVCKKSGRVLIESWARAINLTAGDLVGIQFCVYRNGSMLWDGYGAAASGKTTLSISLIRQVRDVEAGDIICLRAYNSDGARGKLYPFRINVEYL